jgi:transcription-repair coupling factor (superfamily II helicase)
MSAYPIRIEMLSRFCSRGRHGAIARGLADGSVDIVIGTHALVQPGIAFRDLGLVVIDEEQRFGVEHKERLKNVRRLVDLLTLSATPIPRTLYLSLTGGRDMSLIQTPPRDRIPVETVVARNTDAVVRQAILRELNREGQVFYLHNRVTTIDLIRQRLAGLVPEARVVIGHGQMASSELARVMRDFVACRFDVLLCTTIIESGVDIARANTILIDRADRFGLADLYQLRGRVGRSNRTGYAYLLLPPHGHLDADARKRISAVRKFSSLGAGFGLAMRDLEIRGAGNLLGPQQSGHIAAVGFDLYCQLLRRTMARLKGEPAPAVVDVPIRLDFISLSAGDAGAAVIPYAYIEDESLRLSAYRRVAASAELGEITRIRDELRDRFGPLPPETERLLLVAEIRIAAGERRIQSVEVRRGRFLAMRDGEFLMDGGRFPRLRPGTPDRQLAETLDLVRNVDAWGTAAPPRAPARFGVAGDTDSV